MGIAWAILQPVMMMVVFSAVFGFLGKLPSEGRPYPVFAYVGMLPWQYFASATLQGSLSLWGNNTTLLTKVYFPRMILPVSAIIPPLLDFGVAFVVLLFLMLYYGIVPGWKVVLLPLYMGLAVFFSLGLSLWWSAMGAEYRDVRHVFPVILQLWLYVSPVAYSASMIPEVWRTVYALNPMVSVVEGFRECLLGTSSLSTEMLLASCFTCLSVLISGAFVFRQLERKLADVV